MRLQCLFVKEPPRKWGTFEGMALCMEHRSNWNCPSIASHIFRFKKNSWREKWCFVSLFILEKLVEKWQLLFQKSDIVNTSCKVIWVSRETKNSVPNVIVLVAILSPTINWISKTIKLKHATSGWERLILSEIHWFTKVLL